VESCSVFAPRSIRQEYLHRPRETCRREVIMIVIKHEDTGRVLKRVKADTLAHANLTDSPLTGANLTGANLTGANLTATIGLNRSQLTGAYWSSKTTFPPGFVLATPAASTGH
jgi:hypothetical protein